MDSKSTIKENAKYKCVYENCLAAFSKLNKLHYHVRVHRGERPFICNHLSCEKSYTRSFHLIRHQKTHERKEVNFLCSEEKCKQTCKSKYLIDRHYKRIHENRKYKCKECGKAFHKKQHLKVHTYEHTRIKPYLCIHEGCKKRFRIPSKLKAHQKVHQGYVCDVEGCAIKLATWTLFRKHKTAEHNIDFPCLECGKIFPSMTKLSSHSVFHSDLREIFHCPKENCSNFYYKMTNLRVHIRITHEGKRFHCQQSDCSRTFTSKQRLKKHEKCHQPNFVKTKRKVRLKSLAVKLSGFDPKKHNNLEALLTMLETDGDRRV